MYYLPAFLLLFTSISEMYFTTNAFHHPEESPTFHRRTNSYHCTMCDSADCQQSDDPRCEYHREIDHVLEEVTQSKLDVNPDIRTAVDVKLFQLTEQAARGDGECIPHMSQYTSCNKENFCLGCVTCNCDAAGRWNCSETQRCHSDIAVDIDHRVLIQVMENLNDSKHDFSFKFKRSIGSTMQLKKNDKEETLSSQEISSIINGFNGTKPTLKSEVNDDALENDLEDATESKESINFITTEKTDSLNDSDLEFDDLFPVYNGNSGNRTKLHLPMLKNHTEDILDPDYMDTPDDNTTQNDNKRFEKVLENQAKFLKETILDKNKAEARKMIFYANFNKDISDLSNTDKNVKGLLVPGVGDSNDIYERQSVRVVKRQTANITKSVRPKVLNNSLRSVQDLKENVFDPLNSIINTKRNDIKELEKIRDDLKEYLKIYLRNETFLNINQYLLENITKSYFTIYKMERVPQTQNDALSNEVTTSFDYLSKLQNDIYEVIKDIVEIQKSSMYKHLPEDLNILAESMKYYVHRQGKIHIEKEINKMTDNKLNNYRKFLKGNRSDVAEQIVTDTVNEILNVIDKDMPRSNALAPLSVTAKKIMKRIINNNYHENFPNHKLLNVQYNVTKELKDTGTKWYKMTRRIATSRLPDRIMAMKLLHLELSKDIRKIKDVSAFIDFAQSRRFIVTEWNTIDCYAARIGEDLKIISKKIKEIIKSQNYILHKARHITEMPSKLIPRKNSFLQQIKKLLKQSKNDMRNIFKNKHIGSQHVNSPSSDNPLKNFENTKWQNILYGNINRKKRSAIEISKAVRRIKNIIPNYLRDKFSNARKSKATKTKL